MVFIILNIILDLVLINLGFVFSFFLHFQGYHPSLRIFFNLYFFISLIFLFSFAIVNVYKKQYIYLWKLLKNLLFGLVVSIILSAGFLYVFRAKWGAFPSSILPISFIVIFIFIFPVKSIMYIYSGRIKKNVMFLKRGKKINLSNKSVFKNIDEIVLDDQLLDSKDLYYLVGICQSMDIKLSILPEYYEDLLSKKISGNLPDYLPIFFYSHNINLIENFLIYVFDILMSLVIFILSLPVLIAICISIKIDSSGPVIYKQKRVGKNCKPFILYKFRTMYQNAEKNTGPVLSYKGDTRITKVGKFLRKTRLDELPQIFNVLKLDMSLVGPRPERLHFVKEHKALRGIRLSIKPGLTGLAQVRSYYDLKPQHKLKYDYLYIQKRSFMFNLYLLIRTVPVVFAKKGM